MRVPYRQARYQMDSSHELFRLDHNRCILCARCVRVCDEIEGAHTWDLMGGSDCLVITDLLSPWGDSETCTGCGKCVQVCPTGALGVKQGTSAGEMVKDQHFSHPRPPETGPMNRFSCHPGCPASATSS